MQPPSGLNSIFQSFRVNVSFHSLVNEIHFLMARFGNEA